MTTNNSVNSNVGGSQLAAHSLMGNTTGSAANPSAVATSIFIQQVTKQVFTSSGTYTPTTGMVYCIAEGVGSGGGGGGGASVAGTAGAGGGGGGGGYSRAVLTAAQIGASKTVTIGALGNGGAAGNNAGTAGGDTSLGALLVCKGGSGGSGAASGTGGIGGAGGVAGTGDFSVPGEQGDGGVGQGTITVYAFTGRGGNSFFGYGAPADAFNTAVGGNQGQLYGGAGSGGGGWNGGNGAGGSGNTGLLVITEYIAI